MANRSLRFSVIISLVWLFAGVAGCRDAAAPTKTVTVRPDQSQVVFFQRPVALAAARSSSIPAPLVVMLSSNPWKMVIGSDSPDFALYRDGTVIFRRGDGYRSIKLTRSATETLTKRFSSSVLSASSGQFLAADRSDQPDNDLLVYGHGAPFYITVYGSLDEMAVRSKVPKAVLAAFDQLHRFSIPNAQPWLPSEVEVMLSPYEYAPGTSIIWSRKWPNLTSLTTRKRGDSYSVFIPSSELPAVRSFLATRKQKGAVLIGGRKWSPSIRLPFPHEALWMAPNDEIAP